MLIAEIAQVENPVEAGNAKKTVRDRNAYKSRSGLRKSGRLAFFCFRSTLQNNLRTLPRKAILPEFK